MAFLWAKDQPGGAHLLSKRYYLPVPGTWVSDCTSGAACCFEIPRLISLAVTSIHYLHRGGYDESLVLGEAVVLADKACPHGGCRFAEASQRWKLKGDKHTTRYHTTHYHTTHYHTTYYHTTHYHTTHYHT